MAHYIEFPTDEAGVTTLVEADEEVAPPRGVEKAGILRSVPIHATTRSQPPTSAVP